MRAGRRHPLHSAASSLVSGGVPVPLAEQSRAVKSPLLLLLIFDSPVSPPSPPFRCCPIRPSAASRVRVDSSKSSMASAASRNGCLPPLPPPPPPPMIPCPDWRSDTSLGRSSLRWRQLPSTRYRRSPRVRGAALPPRDAQKRPCSPWVIPLPTRPTGRGEGGGGSWGAELARGLFVISFFPSFRCPDCPREKKSEKNGLFVERGC